MSLVKYHKLIEVKFYHQYYDSYTSKDIEITPSSSTFVQLKSYNLLFKQTQEGFVILCPDDKQYLLEKLKSEVLFNFCVNSKNRYFEIFSNVTPSSDAKKYVFSNKELASTSVEDDKSKTEQIKLHLDDFVNEKNVNLCCCNYVIVSELLEEDEVIIQQNDEIIFEGQLNGRESFGELLGSQFGSYEVTLKNLNRTIKLFYLPTSFEKAFCMVELSIGGESTSFSEVNGLEYVVRFESRPVQWNYYFVSEASLFYKKVGLYSGKEELSFSEPEQVELVNGQQALKVTSQSVYHLLHRYNGEQLYAELEEESNDTNSDDRKKKVNLVTPDVTRIKGKRTEESEIYFSDMYIYL